MSQGQIHQLQFQIRVLQVSVIILLAMLVTGATMQAQQEPAEVIRTRGIVIVDDQGRERILLGAPAPNDGRKRKDAATGMVVLGEDGADRVVVGYSPGPQMGGNVHARIADAVGIQINDKDGNERGGFGYLDNGRVVLGLDYPDREAVVLFVADNYAGLMISGDKGKQFERAGMVIDNKTDGVMLKLAGADNQERLMLHVPGDGPARLINRDPKADKQVDVLEQIKP